MRAMTWRTLSAVVVTAMLAGASASAQTSGKNPYEGNAEAIKQAIEGLEATKKQLEEAKAKLAE